MHKGDAENMPHVGAWERTIEQVLDSSQERERTRPKVSLQKAERSATKTTRQGGTSASAKGVEPIKY